MKSSQSRLSRRNFLLVAGAGGVATAAVVATKSPQAQPKKAEAVTGSKGYQLTDHVRKYYETTRKV
jgi:shikimate 5-dehydrogenase